jgi:tRNA modification GTPase
MKTIVALCTAPLNSALHIIRVSGPNAFEISQKILSKNLKKQKNYFSLNYVIDENKEIFDQVLVLEFIAPFSFTGEDVVEISCHGGIFVANKIIKELLKNGAQIAQNGEFSMRSMLNNKMTLLQAEAANNLINSSNDLQLKIASKALTKSVSNNIENLSNDIINLISRIELDIDYPEYEMEEKIKIDEVRQTLSNLKEKALNILENSNKVAKISNGISLCIVGQPNAGKSSLLNAIANEERAIVSEEEGTTRDTVTINVSINNLPLKIIDTAGIRKTENRIENLGIQRAEIAIEKSDIIIHLIDSSKG